MSLNPRKPGTSISSRICFPLIDVPSVKGAERATDIQKNGTLVYGIPDEQTSAKNINLKKLTMKKIISSIVLFLAVTASFAQSLPDFDAIKLERKEDYKPADPYALQAAT